MNRTLFRVVALFALVAAAAVAQPVNKAADKSARKAAEKSGKSRAETSPVLQHLRPNPAKPTAVANPAAQKLVAGMLLTPGFQAELIAAEPDVRQPVAFAIDERGRLWVAEAHSYPRKRADGDGRDRVVIFEDGDGDGTFETRRVFIEGLNLVSAIEVGFGGVWIGAAPELLFIPDRDRDDRPDGAAEVLLDGWGFQDTHETLNSFTWGPDGWLYGNQGVFTTSRIGKPGTPAAERTVLRAGVWRYHPVRREFELFAHGGSNQWGLDFNENGHLFMTHCRSFHGGGGTTHAIRNGHFWNQANANHAAFISNTAPDFAPALKNFLPASARYDSGEGGAGKPGSTAIYGGHSHVGTLIYQGDNWPDRYRGHLFTHNLHGHQMNHQVNVRDGSAYETKHGGQDMLYAGEATYIPVDLQTGPDGAVYMIDWTDLQHCHSPMEERWDRSNGRIYRLSWAATHRPVKVDLAAKTDAELAALHTHKSEWFVRTARRLLQERAARGKIDAAAVAALRRQMTDADAASALRAVWTLHATGALSPDDLTALLQRDAEVLRAWGVQLATERAGQPRVPVDALAQLAAKDRSAMVRLALASAVPMLPAAARWHMSEALAAHGEDAEDRFLPKMIWFGLATVARDDVDRAFAIAAKTALPSLADSIRWFIARTPRGRQLIVSHLAGLSTVGATLVATPAVPESRASSLPQHSEDEGAGRLVRLLAFALQSDATLPMPAGWSQAAARLMRSDSSAVRSATEQLSAVFGDRAVLATMRTRLADESLPVAQRRSAFDVLKRVGDREVLPLYIKLLDHDAFRPAVIPLLAASADTAAATGILRHFPTLNPNDRAAALATLTSRPEFALVLLDRVQQGNFPKKDLTALHVRQMRTLNDERVNRRLNEVWGQAADSSAEMKATIARIKKTYEAAPLWAYSAPEGKKVYERACAACHAINGQGGKLGPELTGSWRNGVDYFLENIVDPNAVVGSDFQLNVITKTDGTVVSGMIEKQTDAALVVRTATETLNVPLREIKTRQTLPQSLMPAGLLEALPEREVIELLKFLLTRN